MNIGNERRPCTVVAGPCSISHNSLPEILDIAKITVRNRLTGVSERGVAVVRVVGLKSRTELTNNGTGMGIDFPVQRENTERLLAGGSIDHLEIPPSAKMARTIYERTGMTVASEICDWTQLPPLARAMQGGPVFIWNPSVQNLGWPLRWMGKIAEEHGWTVGIKNPKWLGESIRDAEDPAFKGVTSMEKTWQGLATYTGLPPEQMVLIQRGVDVPEKGNYRNLPVHEVARRVKERTGISMYFDPSHSLGPKLRDQIVEATVEAMSMTMHDGTPLYDGAVVEAGTSETDTMQHITPLELARMCQGIARFRDLVSPGTHTIQRRIDQLRNRSIEPKSYE